MNWLTSTSVVTVTLVTDGSSDRALLPIAEALFDIHCLQRPFTIRFAEGIHDGPLASKLRSALTRFPCNVLLIHRDAEGQSVGHRESEISAALLTVGYAGLKVHVIPVRMTESWLLLDEAAIRTASGNPNGNASLLLPKGPAVEKVIDAKKALFAAFETASGLPVRRLVKIDKNQARQRVAGLIDPIRLRSIASFRHFESQVKSLFTSTT